MSATLEQRRARQTVIYDRIARANAGGRSRLIRKQVSDQADWVRMWERATTYMSRESVDALVEGAARRSKEAIDLHTERGRVAFGWSGGKDSLALEIVMRAAGVKDCVCVLTNLEYGEFLRWVTDHMPDGLEIVHRPEINMEWLAGRPDMLFPPDAAASGRWFSTVQHTGQKRYYSAHGLELMFLGRRSMDGNFVGQAGFSASSRGRFFNPIHDWSHEHVLSLLAHYDVDLPPTYAWPRGWQVGTGPWPARQFCRDVAHGWAEVNTIDPEVVRQAATVLPSAAQWLERRGNEH